MFVDKTRIYAKAGNGGKGKVGFYRDTLTMHGGPDGGDGGKGGDIIFVADKGLNNLVDFYFTKHYKAENGTDGGSSNAYGKSGKDLILKVPCGTIVKDAETGKVVADIIDDLGEKDRFVLEDIREIAEDVILDDSLKNLTKEKIRNHKKMEIDL